MTPRFLTEVAGLICRSEESLSRGSWSLESCCSVPNRMNSVLEGLRARKLSDIHRDIAWNVEAMDWFESEKSLGEKHV